MYIYYEPLTHRIEHKDYQKARNSLERIPWITAHPLDVRKGTFLSEMSRMAVLNSTRQGYDNAIRRLRLLYIGRGYPVNLIKHWAKTQLEQRWTLRFREPRERERGVLVLKSEFNKIWESFNVRELMNVIRLKWIEGRNLVPWCDEPNCEHLPHLGGLNLAVRLQKVDKIREELVSAARSADDIAAAEFGFGSLEHLLRRARISRYADPSLVPPGPVSAWTPSESVVIGLCWDLKGLLRPVYCMNSMAIERRSSALPPPGGALDWVVRSELRPLPLTIVGERAPTAGPASDGPPEGGLGLPRRLGIFREPMFDVYKSSFDNYQLLVSRKRTTQFGDLFTKWRRDVLLDFQMVAEPTIEELT